VLLWFGLGFVFSLAGDVLLQLPRAYFLPGMAAFFLAHLFYIIGFTQHPLDLDWRLIVPIAGIGITYYELTKRIRAGLRTHDQPEMVIPVSGYAVILSLMLFFAISTAFRPAWGLIPVMLVSLGAALFFFSDASLAYNRFVRPLPAGDLRVMVTYHIGQILLAIGALLQYA
jgi:uncharacterized membrane protein YhhN